MDSKDKIIEDYFAQLPKAQIDTQLTARLIEIGKRTLAEREEVRADRGGIWIAIVTTVVLLGAGIGILQLSWVNFADFFASFPLNRLSVTLPSAAAFAPWAIVGGAALSMLIAYTLLINKVARRAANEK